MNDSLPRRPGERARLLVQSPSISLLELRDLIPMLHVCTSRSRSFLPVPFGPYVFPRKATPLPRRNRAVSSAKGHYRMTDSSRDRIEGAVGGRSDAITVCDQQVLGPYFPFWRKYRERSAVLDRRTSRRCPQPLLCRCGLLVKRRTRQDIGRQCEVVQLYER